MPVTGSTDGDFLLIAAGPVDHRYLKDWASFKDAIRKHVDGQPGWADVEVSAAKNQSSGWCRFERESEARKAYAYFARSSSILVHLFNTSKVDRSYRLMACNCRNHFSNLGNNGHSQMSGLESYGTIRSDVRPTSSTVPVALLQPRRPPPDTYGQISDRGYVQTTPYGYAYAYGQIPAQGYGQAPSYDYSRTSTMVYPAGYHQSGTISAHYGSYASSTPTAPTPLYSENRNGIPVNVTSGTALTESRGIFIKGLNYKTKPENLQDLLSTLPYRPVECKLYRDDNGKCKGHATATFNTPQEANAAIQKLNGTTHMSKRISVRPDKEKTIVKPNHSEPLVVNGSTPIRGGAL